ncbi:interleukin-12 subunit beta-like [Lissotriton helveticus]
MLCLKLSPSFLAVITTSPESAVSLECGSGLQDISWTDTHGNVKARGATSLRFTDVDQPDAGLYTCWSGGEVVTSTYLFIDVSRLHTTSPISCIADSHLHSRLRCNWTQTLHEMPDLIRARAGRGDSDLDWIEVHRIHEGVVTFELEFPRSCPDGEEDSAFTVYVEAVNDHTYVSDNRTMFLRNIIKPGHPENLHMQRLQPGEFQINWTYPSSWSRPHTYFPLLFHLDLHFSNNKTNLTLEGQHVTVPGKLKSVRIKCRDLYYNSEWSDWAELETRRRTY